VAANLAAQSLRERMLVSTSVPESVELAEGT
jgi:hypothetical protein